MLSPIDLQRQTLRLYGELVSRRENYGGQLVFTSGAGCSATGLPAAVSIAGGTSLTLDPDASALKSVFRQGGVDFVVNTLEEALRVLKNEIRQHRPLGVGLIAEVKPVLAEMAERGVLPDLHISIDNSGKGPGRQHLHLSLHEGTAAPTSHLAAWLGARGWSETTISATAGLSLRALDAQQLSELSAGDTIRRTWLQRIAHYQRSSPDGSRVIWVNLPV